MNTIALLDLDTRELHLAGDAHGVARCGHTMRDPWQAGDLGWLADKAEHACESCFDLTTMGA